MKTSADDILVAYLACLVSPKDKPIQRYVDLGCGIGSTLLVVAHHLRPVESIGIEAQTQSYTLLSRTLEGIHQMEGNGVNVTAIHSDLRSVDILTGSVDLITANPPYAPLRSGTLCKDAQRRSARFEMRGGVEDYFLAARRLLTLDGRLIVSFWAQRGGDMRVRSSAHRAQLVILRRVAVKMGARSDNESPHIFIYELIRSDSSVIVGSDMNSELKSHGLGIVDENDSLKKAQYTAGGTEHDLFLDISRHKGESFNLNYKKIKEELSIVY